MLVTYDIISHNLNQLEKARFSIGMIEDYYKIEPKMKFETKIQNKLDNYGLSDYYKFIDWCNFCKYNSNGQKLIYDNKVRVCDVVKYLIEFLSIGLLPDGQRDLYTETKITKFLSNIKTNNSLIDFITGDKWYKFKDVKSKTRYGIGNINSFVNAQWILANYIIQNKIEIKDTRTEYSSSYELVDLKISSFYINPIRDISRMLSSEISSTTNLSNRILEIINNPGLDLRRVSLNEIIDNIKEKFKDISSSYPIEEELYPLSGEPVNPTKYEYEPYRNNLVVFVNGKRESFRDFETKSERRLRIINRFIKK